MILDMKDNMEVFNSKIGKQRIQHHDVAKLGCLMCLTTKIEISCWTEFFKEQLKKIMQTEMLLALSVAKINNKTGFKDNSVSKPSFYHTKEKKVEYQGIHIETVESQQVKVKRAAYRILANVPKWMRHRNEVHATFEIQCGHQIKITFVQYNDEIQISASQFGRIEIRRL